MFSKKLRMAMEEAGLSQAQLSRKSGLSKSTISQYLSGKFEAKPTNLKALSKALNKSIYWLCSDNNEFLIKDKKEIYISLNPGSKDISHFLQKTFSSEDFLKKSKKISSHFTHENLQELLDLILSFQNVR